MHVWLWALVNEDEGIAGGDRGRVGSARPSVQGTERDQLVLWAGYGGYSYR